MILWEITPLFLSQRISNDLGSDDHTYLFRCLFICQFFIIFHIVEMRGIFIVKIEDKLVICSQ